MAKKMKRQKQGKHNEVEYLQEVISQNGAAMMEGPKRKNWTTHDLKPIRPLTDNQKRLFKHYYSGSQMCAYGSAGTGKTYIALWLAMNDILNKDRAHNRLIVIRSAVATRDVGHLPGTLQEKTALYELPYKDIMGDLFGRASTYDDMKDAGIIEFMPTSFIRGLTWNDAIVVVDEGQNMTWHEINSIVTRLGDNTRLIFTGDLVQTDLNKSSRDVCGMGKFLRVIDKMNEFDTVKFTTDDVVRSDLVKSWIIAAEQEEAE
jgi:phosphate starvation-inducible PhoH-like protein